MRFRYPLETVLNVRRWTRDAVMAEELNARLAMREKQAQVTAKEKATDDLYRQLRDWANAGSLDVQRHEVLHRFLLQVRMELESSRKDLSAAESVHEQVRSRLQDASQRVRALERHREMRERQHSRRLASAEHKAQDELWMARVAGRR